MGAGKGGEGTRGAGKTAAVGFATALRKRLPRAAQPLLGPSAERRLSDPSLGVWGRSHCDAFLFQLLRLFSTGERGKLPAHKKTYTLVGINAALRSPARAAAQCLAFTS